MRVDFGTVALEVPHSRLWAIDAQGAGTRRRGRDAVANRLPSVRRWSHRSQRTQSVCFKLVLGSSLTHGACSALDARDPCRGWLKY